MKKISTDLHEMMNMIKCIYNENIEGQEFNMKKGFTLIELLAVIVILAIIALISTPMILGIIEKAKKGGAESSALGYIDAVEKTVATNMLDTNKTNIEDGVYEVSTLKSTTYDIKVKGEQPTDDSWVKIEKGQVTACSLKIGEYVVNCNGETTKNDELEEKPVKSGPTKVEATSTDTHKGIVYLDPTDLTKTCNETNSVSTTGIKDGCMKWYIYSTEGSNYTMILDHNTTAQVAWSSGNNSEMTVAKEALESDTQNLNNSLNARLISAAEIAQITNNQTFDSTTATDSQWYCFDTNAIDTNQDCNKKSQGTSKYAWLFDYTNGCENYGCNIADNSNSGYWTSTRVASDSIRAWSVYIRGSLGHYQVNYSYIYGIRPVITIPKSIIS